ncbi:MAG: SIR2 family protein [Pirellulaceae bacterium]|nr:SIR2 family protein [Pirellulaceae bacterium]
MQLVARGPDIPEYLLQAHEEGRVVFFCGAGISYPAGLPGFQGLVDAIYSRLGTSLEEIEQEAYDRSHFDATLDLLERRYPGQRVAVRTALHSSLKPKLRRKLATQTHESLLNLSQCRDGAIRLVTTNFDRIFEHIIKRDKLPVYTFCAPLLPIPKRSRWNGLVYLHGLLPKLPEKGELNRLVITSGDFGNAYLTERWAARFVSELFRDYVVCFVGYSINDPVLRYMMDALAADRMLGESTPAAYAFGDCAPNQAHRKSIEWEAKGVTPILYEVPSGTHDHSALHNTLREWADIYRDGILGKERIVVDNAMSRPAKSTPEDDYVGRMIWALSDATGEPAKRFADFEPVPPLDWLEAFASERFQHQDLSRFNVIPHTQSDDKLQFSLVRRPAPYTHAPWMNLVGWNSPALLDNVMLHIGRWLLRHLDNPKLVLWMVQHGGQLNSHLTRLIENQLDRLNELESENKTHELEQIRSKSEDAIPRTAMRTLWRLVLAGRVKSQSNRFDLYRWRNCLNRDGLTATVRLNLRQILSVRVTMKAPFRWWEYNIGDKSPDKLDHLVDCEVTLAADHPLQFFREMEKSAKWQNALPLLLNDFQQLLRDSLDVHEELGLADSLNDRSSWHMPSIDDHVQNRGHRDWLVLIELVRDSWKALNELDPVQATSVATSWFPIPFPTFKRLALFAACHGGFIPSAQWTAWLLNDDAWWLWAPETKREAMRLLETQGHQLTPGERSSIEEAILNGPPRKMYPADREEQEWKSLSDRAIWLRLSKLEKGEVNMGKEAAEKLESLRIANPDWKLSKNQKEEFSHWMSGTGFPDDEESTEVVPIPKKRSELAEWLRNTDSSASAQNDNTQWLNRCRYHLLNSGFALCDLAREGNWPIPFWRGALQVWSEKRQQKNSWRYFAGLVNSMPGHILKELLHNVAWWLEEASKGLDQNQTEFFGLCKRILELVDSEGSCSTDAVSAAINHPVGHVAQSVVNVWFNRVPKDNDGLPEDVEQIFTQLCDSSVDKFCHGRVILAANLIPLYRVDRQWTETYLLPLFDWTSKGTEAQAVWEGYLWTPRLYRPLLDKFMEEFLETSKHYAELGDFAVQYATLLVLAGIEHPLDALKSKFANALLALPPEGLLAAANGMTQLLEGAGDQREDYWTNRILPFWKELWPKSVNLISEGLADSLARLCIAARKQFPQALSTVRAWLIPIEHADLVVRILDESQLPTVFPADTLELLDAVVGDNSLAPLDLDSCLRKVVAADPKLATDPRYLRLVQILKRTGH